MTFGWILKRFEVELKFCVRKEEICYLILQKISSETWFFRIFISPGISSYQIMWKFQSWPEQLFIRLISDDVSQGIVWNLTFKVNNRISEKDMFRQKLSFSLNRKMKKKQKKFPKNQKIYLSRVFVLQASNIFWTFSGGKKPALNFLKKAFGGRNKKFFFFIHRICPYLEKQEIQTQNWQINFLKNSL